MLRVRDLLRVPLMTLAVLSIAGVGATSSDYLAGSLTKLEPQAIYSADPHDSWNRILYLLFTRRVECRLTEEFHQPGPMEQVRAMGNPTLAVTSRSFERIEGGDRAIDPLYPNFFSSKGAESVLGDPQFDELKQGLKDALAEPGQRPPLHRALMQADVWAAFETLSWEADGPLASRAREALPMLAQFIRKLALTSEEIASLPNNYLATQATAQLPALFDARSGWIEVEWFPDRLHDVAVNYRRATRIFLKPTSSPQKFLIDVNKRIHRRKEPLPDFAKQLDAATIVLEVLLIDSDGQVVPSPLTYEMEIRSFAKDSEGRFQKTIVTQYELSRKSLLANPSSGGLVRVAEDQPAYLPSSGNDYTFASPLASGKVPGTPILATLRRRCQSCHGDDITSVFTFEMKLGPGRAPRVRQLPVVEGLHAAYVAKQKAAERSFKSLQQMR